MCSHCAILINRGRRLSAKDRAGNVVYASSWSDCRQSAANHYIPGMQTYRCVRNGVCERAGGTFWCWSMREYGSGGEGRDESGRQEHALGNEGVTKGEHYIGIPTASDIGILEEQLYSAKACRRLEILSSVIAYLPPS